MRTAQMVKHFSHVVLLVGIVWTFQAFDITTMAFWAGITGSGLAWLVLRLLAIMGQLLYEIRNDGLRTIQTIDRSLNYANALLKEVRDLADSAQIRK